ncbi:MAG: hypothetical protein M1834_000306 [Cirrosporium novae-zelandiae]|nr:MAG: hypothetical protein M1834_000306 [Cirrosporium novae-zelandiae]
MAARRLVDAAALFNVGRAIISRHFALRGHRLDVYSRTSSLTKVAKQQVNRAALTFEAASALSYRLNSKAPYTDLSSHEKPIPSKESIEGASESIEIREGLNQDHFYEKSQENAATDPPPDSDLGVKQEKPERYPLPDGTIPPDGTSLGRPERDQDEHTIKPNTEPAVDPLAGEHSVIDKGLKPYSSGEPNIPKPAGLKSILPVAVKFKSDKAPSLDNQDASIEDGLSEEMMRGLFRSSHVARIIKDGNAQRDRKHFRGFSGNSGGYGEHINPSGVNHENVIKDPAGHLKATSSHEYISALPQQENGSIQELVKEIGANITTKSSHIQTTSETESQTAKVPYQMRESRVPSSRFGRLWQYSGLATSMAFGAVGESFRRVTGNGSAGSVMLSDGNIERLVAKLSKMRDTKVLSPAIAEVLQRVQDSADYMPASQRDKVLANDLGSTWRDLFSSFDEVPMAAASIGQVHTAVLKSTGRKVAVKIQYPGIADSIDSDLNNLSILLTASRLLPKGLYLEKTIANARTELAWECDYVREAECLKRFQVLLEDDTHVFQVPDVIDEASGKRILTMELMRGVGVTKLQQCDQKQKDWIGAQILRLCLREITEFKFMQTDPNWTNFLFNPKTEKLELLDFGASREYPDEFINIYTRILYAASRGDREACRDLSVQLGYLTGLESHAMTNAHVSSVLTLAEPFMNTAPEVYDFKDQTITDRVRSLIPVMLRERLAPPPEETYSLHRKLSGAFLLCARLGSKVRCREMFADAMAKAGLS